MSSDQYPFQSQRPIENDIQHYTLKYNPTPLPPPQRPARALCGPSLPVVELTGLEPVTPCLQSRCSPN